MITAITIYTTPVYDGLDASPDELDYDESDARYQVGVETMLAESYPGAEVSWQPGGGVSTRVAVTTEPPDMRAEQEAEDDVRHILECVYDRGDSWLVWRLAGRCLI